MTFPSFHINDKPGDFPNRYLARPGNSYYEYYAYRTKKEEQPPTRRKLSRPEEERVTRTYTQCRPATLPEGMDPKTALALDSKGKGYQSADELARMLQAVGADPCPKDHYLAVADVFHAPLPTCDCDIFPEAHGSIKYLEDHAGKTMCMKFGHTYDQPEMRSRRLSSRDLKDKPWPRPERPIYPHFSCHSPHPEYPTVGVKDAGGETYDGCRTDMVPCVFRGIDSLLGRGDFGGNNAKTYFSTSKVGKWSGRFPENQRETGP